MGIVRFSYLLLHGGSDDSVLSESGVRGCGKSGFFFTLSARFAGNVCCMHIRNVMTCRLYMTIKAYI